MMRTRLAGNRHAAFFGFANQAHAARRAQVLAMNFRARQFGEQKNFRPNTTLTARPPLAFCEKPLRPPLVRKKIFSPPHPPPPPPPPAGKLFGRQNILLAEL